MNDCQVISRSWIEGVRSVVDVHFNQAVKRWFLDGCYRKHFCIKDGNLKKPPLPLCFRADYLCLAGVYFGCSQVVLLASFAKR